MKTNCCEDTVSFNLCDAHDKWCVYIFYSNTEKLLEKSTSNMYVFIAMNNMLRIDKN